MDYVLFAFASFSLDLHQSEFLQFWQDDAYEGVIVFANNLLDFAAFNGWLLLASCGYPLMLFLRKDRFSRALLLAIIPYYLIVCHSA